MKISVWALSFSFVFSNSVFAFLEKDTWSLKKGKRHPAFILGKSLSAMESDVFSEVISFQERWKLVAEVADMKTPKKAEAFLMSCLDSKKWFLQSAALKIMKTKNPGLALFYADKLLRQSPALVVRSEAVEVMDALGGPAQTKSLWSALRQTKNFRGTKSLWIRPQIVKTLYKLERSKHSKEEWGRLLTDPDERIKAMAKKIVTRY